VIRVVVEALHALAPVPRAATGRSRRHTLPRDARVVRRAARLPNCRLAHPPRLPAMGESRRVRCEP
jgi:hypothetical protein